MSFGYYCSLGPVTAEVVRNLVPFTMEWNGFGMCKTRNCGDMASCGCCSRSLLGSLAMKTRRSNLQLCEHNMVLMSMKGHSWFGCVQFKILQKSSTKMGNLVALSNAVTGTESQLVYQENKENGWIQKGKDEPCMDSFQKNLPPWGDFMDYQESENESEPESAIQSSTLTENSVAMDQNRIHFLEETNKEELSRRILMLSRSNKVRSALELFRSMEASGLLPNVHACNSLLSSLPRNKRLNEALGVFEFMKTSDITTGHTYSLILKAVADNQGCDSALNMFGELAGEDKVFDVIVFNTMISICGKMNNWVETERIWRSMKENDVHGTEVTYSLLVCIFARCGQNELAIDAYYEMIHNGLKPRDDTMHAVISACSKEGKWDLALGVFQNMLNCGMKPSLVACNALINSLGKAREVKLAFKVFERVKSLGHAPDAYTWNALLSSLYRANQHANALQLFESIKREQSSQVNEYLYNIALMSCQKLGLWDKALQLLWQMEASDLSVPAKSYNLVISACEVARKPKVALQVYEHMVHKKCPVDMFTYLSLVRSCIWASLWDEVEEILSHVAPDVSLYNAVIHGMCLRGKFESAKKLYMKMRDSGLKPDGKTRALMLQNLRKKSAKKRRWSSHSR